MDMVIPILLVFMNYIIPPFTSIYTNGTKNLYSDRLPKYNYYNNCFYNIITDIYNQSYDNIDKSFKTYQIQITSGSKPIYEYTLTSLSLLLFICTLYYHKKFILSDHFLLYYLYVFSLGYLIILMEYYTILYYNKYILLFAYLIMELGIIWYISKLLIIVWRSGFVLNIFHTILINLLISIMIIMLSTIVNGNYLLIIIIVITTLYSMITLIIIIIYDNFKVNELGRLCLLCGLCWNYILICRYIIEFLNLNYLNYINIVINNYGIFMSIGISLITVQ